MILPENMHDQAAYGVLIFAISLSGWVRYARTVRGATLSEKKRDYVQAAKLFGVSPTRIMFTHILPNVLGSIGDYYGSNLVVSGCRSSSDDAVSWYLDSHRQ